MILKKTLLVAQLLFVCFGTIKAQFIEQDKSFRIGKLENGLTYYIKHNDYNKNLADFYIAQKVGSILEEPHQRGLAHFLEHMAFNGTKHFPQDGTSPSIVKWCESVGIKFGVNLNAYTSIDQTVYNISSAPINKKGVIDSCLLILRDWSCDLLLNHDEIDKERGVVHEEWRTRRSAMAMQRLMEGSASHIYKGTKYADAMPIGNMDIIDHFPYKALEDYYKKWYRPDLQAIIVVGDINVDSIEQQIKTMFSSIATKENAPQRIYYPVGNNDKMIVYTAKDKEQPVTSFSLYMKRDVTPRQERATLQAFDDACTSELIVMMLNERLDRMQKENSQALLSASVQDETFFISATKDAFTINATLKQNKLGEGITAVVAEVERARKGGFTQTELNRAKQEMLNSAQNAFNDKNKVSNSALVEMCVNNFLENQPIVSAQTRLNETKRLNNYVSLKHINKALAEMITNKNQVATLFTPDNSNVQTLSPNQIEKTIVEAQQKKYSKYKDPKLQTSFIEKEPRSGQIVKQESAMYGYTRLTLSNGMRVYVKDTPFEDDEINVRAFSLGGKSLYNENETPNLTYLIAATMAGGIDRFDELTLNKMLTGKTVNVTPFIGEDIEGIKANSTVRNAKEMFQLMHLYFTSPRKDSVAFKQLIDSQREFLMLRANNPNVVYNDTLLALSYGNSPLVKPVKASDLNKVNLNRIIEIYKQRFANAADFDVIITGNINLKNIKPLICKYLASLPSSNKHEQRGNNVPQLREVNETNIIKMLQSTASVHSSVIFSARVPYTIENEMKTDVLSQLLRIAYIKSIREEKGGAYSVAVTGNLSQYPFAQVVIKVSFKTAPEKYKEVIPLVNNELENIAKNGVDNNELKKVKAYLLKTYDQVEKVNDYWEEMMFNYIYNKVDFDANYKQRVEALTSHDLQEFAKMIVDNKKRLEVTMTSEK